MGQQQLLLLVLGIVVVGIAIVAGMAAYSEGSMKARRDAAVSDAVRVATAVQIWKLKPGALGGGGNLAPADFTGVTLKALGYPVTGTAYVTASGCYKLATMSGAAEVYMYSGSLAGDCDPSGQIATLRVTGSETYDIIWDF
jgi:hypothetical protein